MSKTQSPRGVKTLRLESLDRGRARAQDGELLEHERPGRAGVNCDLSSGMRADVDVLDALRRDQERAYLRSRRARRPGSTEQRRSCY